jgi:hypothetical protein
MLIHRSLEIATNAGIENSIVAVGQNVGRNRPSPRLYFRVTIFLPRERPQSGCPGISQ